MIRVSGETKDEVLRVAREDFGGVSADETVRRLLGEHFQHQAILAMDRYREEDPEGWQEYLAGAERLAHSEAGIADPWVEE